MFNLAMFLSPWNTPVTRLMHGGIGVVANPKQLEFLKTTKYNALSIKHIDTAFEITKLIEATLALRFAHGLCTSEDPASLAFYTLLTGGYLLRTYVCIQEQKKWGKQLSGFKIRKGIP